MVPNRCDDDQVAKCARELGAIQAKLDGMNGQLQSIWVEIKDQRELKTEFAKYKGGVAVLASLFGTVAGGVISLIVAWMKK